jgi:membrane protease YdiL (CAAX protease family)
MGSNIAFTNENLTSTIIYELIILYTVSVFLKIRDKKLSLDNNLSIPRVVLYGIMLALFYYAVYFVLLIAINLFQHNDSSFISNITLSKSLHPLVIIFMSIVNPVFEETIVTGYVINTLSDRKGVLTALNISVLIRFLYHLYQGPAAAVTIIPLGLIFGFVYLKWKNIWPLTIAHGIMDFLSLYFGSLF